MNSEPGSVASLLGLTAEKPDASATMRSSEGMGKVLGEVGPRVPDSARTLLAGVVERAVPVMLDLPVGDILAHGWNKLRPVFKYREPKYRPNDVYLVSIADPEITSTHHPYLDIMMGTEVLHRVEFDLELALSFETAVLRIQDGRITQIQAGTCKGKGTLKFKKAILFEGATREFKLRGTIDLNPGLEIA